MSDNLIPDEIAQRTAHLINEAENVRAQAVDDLKTIYADLREELKSLGWRGAEVSEQVAAFKAAISEMRLDDEKKAKREAKGDLVSEYINVLTVSRARARVWAGRGVEVGVDTPHDPETGEILESVQSHEAAVVSAPAESASDDMPATNQPETAKDSPHHLVPTRGDDAAMASSQQEGATGRQPVDTLRAGRTGSITVTAGETATNSQAKASVDNGATGPGIEAPADSVAGDASRPSRGGGTPAFNSNPQASPSRQADKAETAPPVVSAAFTNPKCLKPKTCPNAHSKTACFDCVMEYGKRPPEEQKRLWAEAIQQEAIEWAARNEVAA